MALTYTKEVSHFDTKTETVSVVVPKPSEWSTGMKDADLKLTRAAKTLLATLEKVEASKSPKSFELKISALVKFVKKFRTLKVYDTSPRENVWSFVEDAGKAVRLSRGTVSDIWDQAR